MKTLFATLALLVVFATSGFSQAKTSQTIGDLKIAYDNELNASAKYARYAEAARKESLPMVAKLFEATSKAEACHAANHKKVSETLGAKLDLPKIAPINAKSTPVNLLDAINGETYEFETLYPGFLKTAENEDIIEAITTFRYALLTEKRHAILYQSVLNDLQSNKKESISTTWYVCPTCGNVYDLKGVKISCEYCGTLKPRFIVF
jgi:rubrerythrin